MMTRHVSAVVLLAGMLLGGATVSGGEQRYAAMLADGSRVAGDELQEWFEPAAQPKLSGRAVFDAGNPFRWLIDNSLSIADTPPAYVEMVGGDRLPGEVLAYQSGDESPYDRLPPHLIVRPSLDVNWPDFGPETPVRVRSEWLQRVVWAGRPAAAYQPGHVFLRDGRQIAFRSLRWTGAAVTLLIDGGGIQEFPFADLAELHLPRQNPWAAYVGQLAFLSPHCDARLIQLETTEGLRLTTSTERFQARHRGDRNKRENWFQLAQPAWSLDPFWVRFPTIRAWRFFKPHEVPLTLIPPAGVRQESTFGGGWRWQRDRNVQQEPLRSGGEPFGWGFGVQALCELTFDLPPIARAVRTRIGLDRLAGDGGCVRGRVLLDGETPKPLFESEILVGSQKVVDTGLKPLPADLGKSPRLVLAVDPVHTGRPAGADPFDIRDALDWLDPEVHLDPEALKAEVARHAFTPLAGLRDWTPAEGDRAAVTPVNLWDEFDPRAPHYRVLMKTAERFVTVTRSFRVGREDRWLGLAVDRPPSSPPSRVQVRIDGRALAEFAVPPRPPQVEPAMERVPVEEFRGRTVTVELIMIPEEPGALLNWQAVALLDHPPGLVPLFEDDAPLAERLMGGEGQVTRIDHEPHTGRFALRVTPPGAADARLPGWDFAIREHPRLGEFRYLRFAWRKQGGKQIVLGLANGGEFGAEVWKRRPFVGRPADDPRRRPRQQVPADERGYRHGYRYDAGSGTPPASVMRLDNKPPEKWTVLSRDLFADFGNFTLTGLSLGCPDGEAAEFDHLWLARTQDDLKAIPGNEPAAKPDTPPADPNLVRKAEQRADYGEVLSTVAPLFTTDESAGGVWLLKTFRGRDHVVRTSPPKPGQACILHAPFHLPAGRKATLKLTVGHEEKADWQLLVKADGQTLHDSLISDTTAKDGWAEIRVDLSPLAGKKVILELHNHPNNWANESAYWHRVAVEHP